MRADRDEILSRIGLLRGALNVALAHLANFEDGIRRDRAEMIQLGRSGFDSATELIRDLTCELETRVPDWRPQPEAESVLRFSCDGYLGASE